MMPRMQVDIGWGDLAAGLAACVIRAPKADARGTLLTRRPDSLTCLSVRSGLDLLFAERAWPPGSEVLVSAITIPDMSRILREHGLVPVPVDVDPETLAVRDEAWQRAWTPRTRAVLIAHLFGSRLSLDGLLRWAQARDLMVLEDCAQAFAGDGWTGDPRSDLRLFSFGPIKTATALGGAILLVKDAALRARLRRRQTTWPVQSTASFLRRVLKFTALKPLQSNRGYALLVAVLRLLGRDHDEAVRTMARGFAGGDFFHRLRHRPCAALIRLLERRLRTYDSRHVEQRRHVGAALQSQLSTVRPLGASAPGFNYWVFPLRVADREAVMHRLWAEGFDATCGASSLHAVPAPEGHAEPVAARDAMRSVLYIPAYPAMGSARLARLAQVLNDVARPPA